MEWSVVGSCPAGWKIKVSLKRVGLLGMQRVF